MIMMLGGTDWVMKTGLSEYSDMFGTAADDIPAGMRAAINRRVVRMRVFILKSSRNLLESVNTTNRMGVVLAIRSGADQAVAHGNRSTAATKAVGRDAELRTVAAGALAIETEKNDIDVRIDVTATHADVGGSWVRLGSRIAVIDRCDIGNPFGSLDSVQDLLPRVGAAGVEVLDAADAVWITFGQGDGPVLLRHQPQVHLPLRLRPHGPG